jgi:hypothetical protein
MLTVHVRVTDAETGICRMPFGRSATFATGPGEQVGGHVLLGDDVFSYIDGVCEVHLPPGPVQVEVHKGLEYEPIRREVVLAPGKVALRLTLQRAFDWRSRGWYSGEGRAHELSPHAAKLEGAAEGLDVVNLLATDCVALLAFSGTQPALPGASCVVVNTLNTHPVLGTVALLNCHRVVHPLRFGSPDGLDDWSVVAWCDQCHRKKGLVVWPDLPRLTAEHPQGEALAALLLGKVDAFEFSNFDDPSTGSMALWYRLLAGGLRLPLIGASGKNSNRVALGAVRTYARLEPDQEFSYGAWIEAVRAGRTFITNGPLLALTVNGCDPGDELSLPDERQMARVAVEAQSVAPFDCLELLYNGEVVATSAATMEVELPLAASGWLAARCRSGNTLRAHTSPVYVRIENRPLRPNAEMFAPLFAALERTLTWVRNEAQCDEHQREQLAETLLAAGRSGFSA